MNAKITFTEKPIFNYPNNKFIFTSKIDGLENSWSLCFIVTLKVDELTYIGYTYLLFDPNQVFPVNTKFKCFWGDKVLLNGEII